MSGSLTYLLEPRRNFHLQQDNTLTDSLMTFSIGGQNTTLLDIGDIAWERIVLDIDVTNFSGGSSVTFKLKTVNVSGGTAISNTTMDAKNGAGTTVKSAAYTAAGRQIFSVARLEADVGAATIGRFLAVYQNVNGTFTLLKKNINVYVGI